jgi:sugar phosphate isomerase/epimerase
MFKLAFSTNAFRKFDIVPALQAISRCGYEGVEILGDIPHAYPPHTDEAKIQRIRTVLDELDLQPANVNAFMLHGVQNEIQHPSWIEPDPEFRKLRLKHTIDCLKLAAELGAPSIQTQPGGPVDPSMTRGEALEIFIEGLREALPVAEELEVKLLIEPEPDLLIENVQQTDDLFHRVHSSMLGLNFDIGHFYCVGEDVPAAIRHFSDRIDHVHLEDIPADRTHYHMVPGEGAIDFKPILDSLREIGYEGFVTIELYMHQDNPEDVARRSFTYITDLMGTAIA